MMKKLLLSFALILVSITSNAQVIASQGFDDITTLSGAGWTILNLSSPTGSTSWFQGSTPFAAYSGAATSYIGVNYNSTAGTGVISNWLITPSLSLQNGDVISFYTRTTNVGANLYPDSLELRLSTNGAFSSDPNNVSSVGDYTNLAIAVNPDLLDDYPHTWTLYSYTISGLTGPTDCKIAFRYYVTDGGPSGNNSDYIGIDSFSVNRPLASTQSFFASNFSIQPNPVNDVFNITAKNGISLEKVQVMDINGRIVNETSISGSETAQINISDLTAGVYFVKVQSDLGVGTSKIIKK
ncbi:choice-of-anchor J domain-containing protein [Flavobacterium sp. SUN052]|uniref:T9SS-dependent choice-of-anchor J family protein n=1 Tax=Flavobacterium sp. SUN052 TaxID=3002441 RepID=UPI00237E5F78|nr:choice-of-anchor J domain-containing protein [Flavobacterium sp. SUN052]MEC4004675.1 choice-of-anchor J domain-containing protein [Flavobacterium sp. SUN052]